MGTELEGVLEGWSTLCEDRLRAYRTAAQARQRDGGQGQAAAPKS